MQVRKCPSSEAMSLSLLASLSFVLCCGGTFGQTFGHAFARASPRTVFYMWNTPALQVSIRAGRISCPAVCAEPGRLPPERSLSPASLCSRWCSSSWWLS